MIFVLGGAYQGKEEFARTLPGGVQARVYVCREDGEPDLSAPILCHIERFHLYALRNRLDAAGFWQAHGEDIAHSILIADDISSGIVPMEAEARAWRELCGRTNQRLARQAEAVYRVFCGLGVRIR